MFIQYLWIFEWIRWLCAVQLVTACQNEQNRQQEPNLLENIGFRDRFDKVR